MQDFIKSPAVNLKVNKDLVDAFIDILPKHYTNAIKSKILINKFNEHPYIKDLKIVVTDSSFINELSWISLVHYKKPIGSCQKGRYLIINDDDKQHAIDFLQKRNAHVNSDGQVTEKFATLCSLKVFSNRYKKAIENSPKKIIQMKIDPDEEARLRKQRMDKLKRKLKIIRPSYKKRPYNKRVPDIITDKETNTTYVSPSEVVRMIDKRFGIIINSDVLYKRRIRGQPPKWVKIMDRIYYDREIIINWIINLSNE